MRIFVGEPERAEPRTFGWDVGLVSFPTMERVDRLRQRDERSVSSVSCLRCATSRRGTRSSACSGTLHKITRGTGAEAGLGEQVSRDIRRLELIPCFGSPTLEPQSKRRKPRLISRCILLFTFRTRRQSTILEAFAENSRETGLSALANPHHSARDRCPI